MGNVLGSIFGAVNSFADFITDLFGYLLFGIFKVIVFGFQQIIHLVQNSGEMKYPLYFLIGFLIFCLVALSVMYSPHIIAIVFVAVPLGVWLLKMLIGWIVVFLLVVLGYILVQKAVLFVTIPIGKLNANKNDEKGEKSA